MTPYAPYRFGNPGVSGMSIFGNTIGPDGNPWPYGVRGSGSFAPQAGQAGPMGQAQVPGTADPLAGMDYMPPPQWPHFPQFPTPQSQGQQQGQQKGKGLLSNFVNPSTVTSFFGGGTGGANFGDVAHNYLGGLMNPSGDPFGLASKNAAAGLTSPELTGEEMTSLVGGNGVGSGVASSSALDGAAGSGGAGGLSGLFGGGSGGGGLGAAGPAGLFAALIGMGKNTEANHPDTAMGKGLLGLLGPSISQVVKDPVGMGLPTLLGAPFLTPFTSSKESQATKPEWSGLFGMGF